MDQGFFTVKLDEWGLFVFFQYNHAGAEKDYKNTFASTRSPLSISHWPMSFYSALFDILIFTICI